MVDSDVTGLALGEKHSMILKADGSVWATGRNEYGQLGDGTTSDRLGLRLGLELGLWLGLRVRLRVCPL